MKKMVLGTTLILVLAIAVGTCFLLATMPQRVIQNIPSPQVLAEVQTNADALLVVVSDPSDFVYVDLGTAIEITGYRGTANILAIPSTIIGKPVTRIAANAFQNYAPATAVTIPASVVSIGAGAFQNCVGLTEINLPAGITVIENFTFADCTSLFSIALHEGITTIGEGAFSGCSALQMLTMPQSLTEIGVFAFEDCTALKNVTLNDLDRISDAAFIGCTSLKKIVLKAGLTFLGDQAFANCSSLRNAYFYGDANFFVTEGYDVFIGCAADFSYHTVQTEGVWGFIDNGTSAEIVDYLGSDATLTIPTTLGGLPVTSIREDAIAYNQTLTTITFPAVITSIGDGAFYDNSHLATVYMLGNAPTMGTGVFTACAPELKIFYTIGSTGFNNPWYGYLTVAWDPVTGMTMDYRVLPENILRGVQPNTTSTQMMAGFHLPENWTMQIKKTDGELLGSAEYVGTGMTVEIFNGQSTIEATYTVVMIGDLNGDGRILSVDLLMLKQFVLNKLELTGYKYMAGNSDGGANGLVNPLDLLAQKRHMLKLYTIVQ